MLKMLLSASVILPMSALPAAAEMLHFHAIMQASSEVPANSSGGQGVADATLDTATGKLVYTVSWSGLTGPATMAHFHGPAPAGKNAGVEINLGMNPASPVHGSATLSADQAKALEGGDMYVNVHTAAHKGGEIRGQLAPVT